MTAIVKNKFRLYNADCFKNRIIDPPLTENLYLFVGKSSPWPTVVTPPSSETAPPLPLDSVKEEYRAWHDMLALKRVKLADVIHVIRRYNWDDTGNTQYIPFDDCDAELFLQPTTQRVADASAGGYTAGAFYVVTDEFNVYKCLGNDTDPTGNPNRLSTDKPTGTDVDSFFASDGYKWKYMYTLPHANVLKFMTNDWMPVETFLIDPAHDPENFQFAVQGNAVDGGVEAIVIENVGAGYPDTFSGVVIQAVTASTLTIDPATRPGETDVDNYFNDSTILVNSGGGSNGDRKIVTNYVGATGVMTLDSSFAVLPTPFSDTIDSFPTITIVGDGTGLIGTPVVIPSSGEISSVVVPIPQPGEEPFTQATAAISGSYSGLVTVNATARVIISPKGGHGFDAIKELGGHNIMVNVQLEFNEGSGDFPIANDYRKIGLVIDVENFGGGISEEVTLTAMSALNLTGVNGTFTPDEIIDVNAGEKQAIVVEYVELTSGPGGTGILKFFQDLTTGFVDFADTDIVTGLSSGAAGVSTEVPITAPGGVIPPEVEHFEGDILYIEQRRPIMRAIDQIEDIKIIAEF